MSGPIGAAIRVTRDKGRSRDRRRAYRVFVDQAEVGELRRGETREFPVAPGTHMLRATVDFEHSGEWSVSLAGGGAVHFVCRSRGKKPSDDYLDVFLADPTDQRAQPLPSGDIADWDLAKKQRAVTRSGEVVAVWAHRSGYLRSFDAGSGSGSGDSFLVELALYILVLPVLCGLRWVRHRLLFHHGWSVGVVRKRRFLWPEKVLLERFPDEAQARARAAEVLSEVGSWPRA